FSSSSKDSVDLAQTLRSLNETMPVTNTFLPSADSNREPTSNSPMPNLNVLSEESRPRVEIARLSVKIACLEKQLIETEETLKNAVNLQEIAERNQFLNKKINDSRWCCCYCWIPCLCSHIDDSDDDDN